VTAETFNPGHIVCLGGSIRWPLRLLRKVLLRRTAARLTVDQYRCNVRVDELQPASVLLT
jgi:hypothetical protein